MREVCHTIDHFLHGGRVGIVKGGHLDGPHDRLQHLAQHVAQVHHPIGHLRHRRLSRERVSDKHKLVCAENDEFAMCHKDSWRLSGFHAAEKSVHCV